MLDNAVKFTPCGSSVTVTLDATEQDVEISVRDTGPGIPLDELDHATDRFWRSPAQSGVDGSGLGLAIAARTVELAAGRAVIAGRGTGDALTHLMSRKR